MIKCEFCQKDFSSKSILTAHQKTTKYCLEIQGKTLVEDYKCTYCDKKFTTQTNLKDHCGVCKEKIKKQYEEKIDNHLKTIKKQDLDINKLTLINDENKEKINNMTNDIKQRDRDIEVLNQIIGKLESKLESYEKKLFDMASRPNTTHNNNNNKTLLMNVINNTNLPLTNDVLRQCATTFTIDNARNIDGITKHLTSSLEDHISCTDPSRNVFKYTNDKDEEIVDADLENLLPQYLTALKDENNFLYKEVFNYFKSNNVSLSEQTDYNIFYNALNAIIEQKGEQNKYSEKMKKYIVRQCKKQFLEKNKNKEKEITKELTNEEIMMCTIKSGGSLQSFLYRLFDMEDLDNETDEQYEYRRKMEDLFKQKKKEWKEEYIKEY